MKPLSDIAAERAILSGICQHGQQSYLDVIDIIQSKTFTVEYNQLIFSCLKHIFENNENAMIDVASIYSSGEELGMSYIMTRPEVMEHIRSLFNFPILEKNVRKFAAKIRKLEIARLLREQLKSAGDSILEIEGNESITEILGIAENAIFDFSSLLNDSDNEPKLFSDNLYEYVQHLADNPIDQMGIPTGFPEYDRAIGGGLRKGTINVVGARSKVGKTTLSLNIGYNIANNYSIPVLNMDTEMTFEDHIHKTLAMSSECFIHDIETGKYAEKPQYKNKVLEIAKKLEQKKIPYYHKSIAGMPFEEQLAIMRRWLVKTVGLKSDGKANDCLIVYDYLKLMSSEKINNNMAEFQALGFMISSLHNFSVRYGIPVFALIQLNREGIVKEGTDVASGSDRIIWLCSNFSIFKEKSDEEIAQDGINNGNRKLVPIVSRHGAGLSSGDYINCFMQGSISKIVEGKTKFQLIAQSNG